MNLVAYDLRNGTDTGNVGTTLQSSMSLNSQPIIARPLKSGGNDRGDDSHETYIPVARALTAPPSPRYDGETENFVVGVFAKTTRPHFQGDAEQWAGTTVAPTLNGFDAGESRAASLAAAHSGVRRLTVAECERLQALPDGWTCVCGADGEHGRCKCPGSPRYAALGDAMTATVAEWIGRRILASGGGPGD